MRLRFVLALTLLGAISGTAWSQTARFSVELGPDLGIRLPQELSLADAAVRRFGERVDELISPYRRRLSARGRADLSIPFTIPAVVSLTRNGQPLAKRRVFAPLATTLTLQFDANGPGSFQTSYRQLLESVFSQARSTMDAVFGEPAISATVRVRNYDAEISDRQAVAGGFYLPDNGSGQPEIRFPVYQNPEAAAVNFVHCLLLAYLGPNAYELDAFQEGLVRAATMRVVRTAGALPVTLAADQVDRVLENTYDAGEFYDVWNQRPLGAKSFIAPNLLNTTLPPGGSLGGIYLLRYQMAGSAWQKLLAEYPGFIAEFNRRFYLSPNVSDDFQALMMIGQQSLDTLAGTVNATVEGRSFSQWAQRQFVLDPSPLQGPKLFVHPVSLLADPGTSDFGVFLVQATWFETLTNGDEVLSSGVSYPIFWTPSYDRIFPSAQEDRMDIAGAYGSVVPNLPDLISNKSYVAPTDIPVGDRIRRVYLPAGAYSRSGQAEASNFYGTAIGFSAPAGSTLRLKVTIGSVVIDGIPLENGAFGTRLVDPAFLGYASLRVEVIRNQGGSDTVLLSRRVNKGPGPIWLDLRANGGEAIRNLTLSAGLQTVGLSIEPFLLETSSLLQDPGVLAARWNPARARYDIFPDGGGLESGLGWFARFPTALGARTFTGSTGPGASLGVALRPGWNSVVSPIAEAVPVNQIRVIRAAEFPKLWAQAIGTEIGAEFFEFVPGPNDQASGVPEGGTLVPASSFQPDRVYLVRSLAAEPVVLLFSPAAPVAPLRAATVVVGRSEWTMRLKLSGSTGFAQSEIGMTGSATERFDPREDVERPPHFAGMSAYAMPGRGAGELYRDLRRVGSNAIYRVKFSGLKLNGTYRLDLRFVQGRPIRYRFRDGGSFRNATLYGNGTYSFRAMGPEREFEIEVRGGGR